MMAKHFSGLDRGKRPIFVLAQMMQRIMHQGPLIRVFTRRTGHG